MPHDWIAIAAGVAALSAAAAALALMLRWSAVPGGRAAAAVVAGIVVGLLMGPGVCGRVWPAWHERAFRGGEQERRALADLSRRHAEEVLALTASGVTADAIEEHRRRQAEEAEPFRSALAAALRTHGQRLSWVACGVLGIYLACIGPSLVPRASARRGATSRRRAWRGWTGWGGRSVGAGFLVAILSCAVPAALGAWLMSRGPREAIALGLILGAPGVAAVLRPARLVAAAVGALACSSVAVLIGWSLGLTIAATGLCLGLMLALGIDDERAARRTRRALGRLAHALFLPAAAAIGAVTVDLQSLAGSAAGFWWAIVIAVVWSSDGRWLAWMIGLRSVLGEGRAWSASARCVNAGAGVVQVALTIVLADAGLADGPAVAAGLLGAALVEVTRGARAWIGAYADSGRAGD